MVVEVVENYLVLYNRVFSYICSVECASDFRCCCEVPFMSPTGIAITCCLQPHLLQAIFCIPVSMTVVVLVLIKSPTTFQKVLRQLY